MRIKFYEISHTLNEESESTIIDNLRDQLRMLFYNIGLTFDAITDYDFKYKRLNCLVAIPMAERRKYFKIEIRFYWSRKWENYEIDIPEQSDFSLNDLDVIGSEITKMYDAMMEKRFKTEFLKVISTAMYKIENL